MGRRLMALGGGWRERGERVWVLMLAVVEDGNSIIGAYT